MYNADKPIKTNSEDKFGRNFFSKQLADAICDFPAVDSFVVGLYGEWGSGKTSILNMTMDYLGKLSKDDCDRAIVIVLFNPWNFTSCDQLINQFFKTILVELNCKDTIGYQSKIGQALMKYSSVLELTEYIPVVGKYLKVLSQVANGAGAQLSENAEAQDNNIALLKKKVIEALSEYPGKIVIVIDDIDRLPNEQIRLIFQLITSVADFPHTVYLLSFDKKVVVNALKETQQCDGDEYLKKVIQVPFEVPYISHTKIQNIFLERITDLHLNIENEPWGEQHWQQVYSNCISPFIKTLRDVNRLLNLIEFKYPPLANEINFSDLAGITSLQIYAPEIFEWIRNNRFTLLGPTIEHEYNDLKAKENKESFLEVFRKVYPRDPDQMLSVLSSLFPNVAYSVNIGSDEPDDRKLRLNLSIAHSEHFESYFSLSLENVKISRADLIKHLYEMSPIDVRTYCNNLIAKKMFSNYLSEVEAFIEEIPLERVSLFITEFFNMADYYQDLLGNWVACPPTLQLRIIIIQLLCRIESEAERKRSFIMLIEESNIGVFFTNSQIVNTMELALGRLTKHGIPSWYGKIAFDVESILEIERAFVSKIVSLSKQYDLLEWNCFSNLAYLWRIFDEYSYDLYVHELLKSPLDIGMFLYRFLIEKESFHVFGGTDYFLNLDDDFPNLEIRSRIFKVVSSSVDNGSFFSMEYEVQIAIATFFLSYQGISSDNENNSNGFPRDQVFKQIRLWKGVEI